ncbi:fructose-1-phosphate/6-phosphogluconate phosphatase [Neiella marina]|uniref:Fructose-1-phosphate/6-phosphogluconate phosphatase n=1 Tax=Neiella marina TaxID=508461 RepID=A0A8J2XPB7_9GAMM|nr:beta-phosphoglucomutase family hydrolase [Neiella marina]GGA75500.1 fructose-1-phosphate/6-phosphogluconate phosphatase [Neiella marina]
MTTDTNYDHYDAIIFDMDGTLVDSGQLHEFAWRETLQHFGIPIDSAKMRSLAGVPTIETLEILIADFNCQVVQSVQTMNDYKEALVRKVSHRFVQPTALVNVAKQYVGQIPMSIGTGAYTEEAKEILQHCGLSQYLDHVVGADQVAAPKPAPDTFLRCAELMGVAPSKCLVFEDSKMGLEAASRAGMAGIDVLKEFGIENNYFLIPG